MGQIHEVLRRPFYARPRRDPRRLERAEGLEPSIEPWEGPLLPLQHARIPGATRHPGARTPGEEPTERKRAVRGDRGPMGVLR